MTHMRELVDKDIKSYYKNIPYIQEAKRKTEHVSKDMQHVRTTPIDI